jgi:hypothetical protein
LSRRSRSHGEKEQKGRLSIYFRVPKKGEKKSIVEIRFFFWRPTMFDAVEEWAKLSFFSSLSAHSSHFSRRFFSSNSPQRCPPSSSSAAWRRPSWAWARGPCGSTLRRRPRSRWPTPVSFSPFFCSRWRRRRRLSSLRDEDGGKPFRYRKPCSSPKLPAFNRGSPQLPLEAENGGGKQWSSGRWDF